MRSARCHSRDFQYSSASRKFGNRAIGPRRRRLTRLSVLFCESKIRKSSSSWRFLARMPLSVLFCESKIRKSFAPTDDDLPETSFSTLLRVENSEIRERTAVSARARLFQYSSASRKFGNVANVPHCLPLHDLSVLFCESKIRKFEANGPGVRAVVSFSTLLRVENSEIEESKGIEKRSHIPFSTLLRVENSEIAGRRTVGL